MIVFAVTLPLVALVVLGIAYNLVAKQYELRISELHAQLEVARRERDVFYNAQRENYAPPSVAVQAPANIAAIDDAIAKRVSVRASWQKKLREKEDADAARAAQLQANLRARLAQPPGGQDRDEQVEQQIDAAASLIRTDSVESTAAH